MSALSDLPSRINCELVRYSIANLRWLNIYDYGFVKIFQVWVGFTRVWAERVLKIGHFPPIFDLWFWVGGIWAWENTSSLGRVFGCNHYCLATIRRVGNTERKEWKERRRYILWKSECCISQTELKNTSVLQLEWHK